MVAAGDASIQDGYLRRQRVVYIDNCPSCIQAEFVFSLSGAMASAGARDRGQGFVFWTLAAAADKWLTNARTTDLRDITAASHSSRGRTKSASNDGPDLGLEAPPNFYGLCQSTPLTCTVWTQ